MNYANIASVLRKFFANFSKVFEHILRTHFLDRLGVDFNDEESVKAIIAKAQWSVSRKVNAVDAYDSLLKKEGKTWTPPIYKRIRKLPFIPTEMELDSS